MLRLLIVAVACMGLIVSARDTVSRKSDNEKSSSVKSLLLEKSAGLQNRDVFNSCDYSKDMVCDEPLYCITGTDCDDCGTLVCTNECVYSNDGECDDGGHNSDWSVCPFGSDCNDCGNRCVNLCDSCQWSNDGVCDDGGLYSETSACPYNTDCSDCALAKCDTCQYAFDNYCDDAMYCEVGTDCTDCGVSYRRSSTKKAGIPSIKKADDNNLSNDKFKKMLYTLAKKYSKHQPKV